MTLLAIIFAFALFHWVPKPTWMTSSAIVADLNAVLRDKVGIDVAQARFVLILTIPLLIMALLSEMFNVSAFHHHGGFRYLLFHSLLLFYCLGPKPMETAIEDGALLQQLNLDEKSSHKSIIDGMTDAALHRWFGVFVWYLVFGLWGALLYRVTQQLSQTKVESPVMKAWCEQLMAVLNFPAAMVMVVVLAVASDFEKVWLKCKPFLNSETLTELNCQFLYDAMYHSVEYGEIEASQEGGDEQNNGVDNKSLQVVTTTMAVLKRMLVACLVFVALLVIFSAR